MFRVALTGDFLNEAGAVAYGDAGLEPALGCARGALAFRQRPGPRSAMTRITGRGSIRSRSGPSTSRTSTV